MRSNADALAALADELEGTLTLPGPPEYEVARRPWNRAVDQHPLAVASPAGLDDLRRLLSTAGDSDLTLAVQPGGHGAGPSVESSILVRMSAFDTVDVDLDAGTAVVAAGVSCGALQTRLDGTGWAAACGTSPVVSVAGLMLGGGHSWLSRSAGLAAQTVRRAEMLLPDGTHRWVDDDGDPDLMAALRGAGGLLGIVTALELDLVPVPGLVGGALEFDAGDSAAVLRACRELARNAPAGLNVFVTSSRMPDLPFLPEQIRGRSWIQVEAVATDGAEQALAPVRECAPVVRDTLRPIGTAELATLTGEPTDPGAAAGWSALIDDLDDATIDALVAFHRSDVAEPMVGLQVRMLGGALGELHRPATASVGSAGWLLYSVAPIPPGQGGESARAAVAALRDTVESVTGGGTGTLTTFLAPAERLERSLTAQQVQQLVALRARLGADRVLHPGRLPAGAGQPPSSS